jgi:hypothetical protein
MNFGQWWAEHAESVITLLIGGLLGALANWFFYLRAEKPKLLGWERISAYRIISASEDQRKHLLVTYKDREVKNPYIRVLRVRNIGKQEIRQSDFTEPISFDFGNTELVAHEISGASSSKVKVSETGTSNSNLIQYMPELLNRDQSFELQFVTDGDPGLPTIDTCFAGQSEPMGSIDEKRLRRDNWLDRVTTLALLAILIMGIVTLTFTITNPDSVVLWAMLWVTALVVGLVAITGVYRLVRLKLKDKR